MKIACVVVTMGSGINWALENVSKRVISYDVNDLRIYPSCSFKSPDDAIKWKHFPRYWPFVRGIHRSPVNSPHKGQWRVALMFYLICVWINGWVYNRKAGDLRRYRSHYDVTVMLHTTLNIPYTKDWAIHNTGLRDWSNCRRSEKVRILTTHISFTGHGCAEIWEWIVTKVEYSHNGVQMWHQWHLQK